MPGEGRGAQGQPGRPSPNAGAGTTCSISRPGFHLAFALNFKSGWKSVWSDNPRLIHLQVHTRVHTGIVSFRCAVSPRKCVLQIEDRTLHQQQDRDSLSCDACVAAVVVVGNRQCLHGMRSIFMFLFIVFCVFELGFCF